MTENPTGTGWYEPGTYVQDNHLGTSMRGESGQPYDTSVVNVPPAQDAVPVVMDSTHNTIEQQARQIAALQAKIDALAPKPQDTMSAPLGGAPISHHLHLVDGRVVPNHGGIGTHYSEVLPGGETRITRIAAFYPVDEISPVGKFD